MENYLKTKRNQIFPLKTKSNKIISLKSRNKSEWKQYVQIYHSQFITVKYHKKKKKKKKKPLCAGTALVHVHLKFKNKLVIFFSLFKDLV